MTEVFKRLKSGTDIRGVAVGADITLTEAIGLSVGGAFARWLAEKLGKPAGSLTIAVGRDSRLSGPALMGAIIDGITREPVTLLDCGLSTTPAMFMTTALAGCDGAVMVTASHLPWQRNGYKFFTPEGGLEGADIERILAMAAETPPVPGRAGSVRPCAFLDRYAGFLADMARAGLGDTKPLRGLHVVVDAGNGAGGFYAAMLETLGACTAGSQFLDPDGRFPNHIPNPEDGAAMASLSEAVLRAGADMGVLFDADCDRAALVDGAGREINRNRLIALIADVLLRERPGVTIVTDSVTSAGLNQFIVGRGGTLHRFKRGYRNVIGEAVRLNAQGVDCPLAMETSGHAAFRENRFLDDGMYLVTRLIIEAGRRRREGEDLFSAIRGLREPLASEEIRLPIRLDDFRHAGEAAVRAVGAAVHTSPGWQVDDNNREGVRGLWRGEDNWFLLRLSVHDPFLVLNAEAGGAGIRDLLALPYQALQAHHAVDLTALEARLHSISKEENP